MTSLPDHFHIMEGLTYPDLDATVVDEDGTAVDLTGGSVAFYMKAQDDGAMKINGAAASIVVAASGTVRYTFTAADTDEPGDYWGWFVATVGAVTVGSPDPLRTVVHVTPMS